jgi:hypothetical protein
VWQRTERMANACATVGVTGQRRGSEGDHEELRRTGQRGEGEGQRRERQRRAEQRGKGAAAATRAAGYSFSIKIAAGPYMRVCDAWQARARRAEAAWRAMQRRGEQEAWQAMLRRARRHPLARRASSDSGLLIGFRAYSCRQGEAESDMRVGDDWQARARREKAAWPAMQRRGEEGAWHAMLRQARQHPLVGRAVSDSGLQE